MMASHCTLRFDAKVKENGCHNQVKETKVVLSTDFLEWGWGLNTEISGFWKQKKGTATAVAPPKNSCGFVRHFHILQGTPYQIYSNIDIAVASFAVS